MQGLRRKDIKIFLWVFSWNQYICSTNTMSCLTKSFHYFYFTWLSDQFLVTMEEIAVLVPCWDDLPFTLRSGFPKVFSTVNMAILPCGGTLCRGQSDCLDDIHSPFISSAKSCYLILWTGFIFTHYVNYFFLALKKYSVFIFILIKKYLESTLPRRKGHRKLSKGIKSLLFKLAFCGSLAGEIIFAAYT